MKEKDSEVSFYGIGGDKMKSAGMHLSFHTNQMAFLGFVEVIKHLPFIRKVQRELLQVVERLKIKTAVLIDYPGFNLNFAAKLKKLGVKIIYYISPQIWAWGEGRIKKIKKLVDKMLVILPFEEEFYKKNGIEAEFVGHPLIEQIEEYKFPGKDEFFEKYHLEKRKKILLILPGSRLQEVEKIFPEVIKAAEVICNEFDMQIVVGAAPGINADLFYELSASKNFKVIKDETYELMKFAELGIVKSGTSTLEAALMGLPFIIVYKTSFLTYLIGRNLISLKNIGLVNIVAGETVVPELIQNEVNPGKIVEMGSDYLLNQEKIKSVKQKLEVIKGKLGSKKASMNAASIIYSFIK